MSIPDEYVFSSNGKMKAKRFGNGPGSGEKWDEGEVFHFAKKFDGQTIYSDKCTIAVRNDEVMFYNLEDHQIQKNGKLRIKRIILNETIPDIDIKAINTELVYEAQGNNLIPVWHVKYKNCVFKYNAVTGENYYEK
ncbi:MAG: hypothetical protein JW787_15530 [Sedimentisphaerales bacterium]|nr:hypothetical protein [Sedimentisphaerales bacterium]